MLVICFDKNVLLGGLGDRVVGLISIKVISKLLRRPFYILWNKEDIKEYIDYSEYDYELLESDYQVQINVNSYTENQDVVGDMLENFKDKGYINVLTLSLIHISEPTRP